MANRDDLACACCFAPRCRLLGTSLSLAGAAGASFANFTDSLLQREAFIGKLASCSSPGSNCYSLSMCAPCHCSLLSKVAPARAGDARWVLGVRQECSGFISTVDVRAYVMR